MVNGWASPCLKLYKQPITEVCHFNSLQLRFLPLRCFSRPLLQPPTPFANMPMPEKLKAFRSANNMTLIPGRTMRELISRAMTVAALLIHESTMTGSTDPDDPSIPRTEQLKRLSTLYKTMFHWQAEDLLHEPTCKWMDERFSEDCMETECDLAKRSGPLGLESLMETWSLDTDNEYKSVPLLNAGRAILQGAMKGDLTQAILTEWGNKIDSLAEAGNTSTVLGSKDAHTMVRVHFQPSENVTKIHRAYTGEEFRDGMPCFPIKDLNGTMPYPFGPFTQKRPESQDPSRYIKVSTAETEIELRHSTLSTLDTTFVSGAIWPGSVEYVWDARIYLPGDAPLRNTDPCLPRRLGGLS